MTETETVNIPAGWERFNLKSSYSSGLGPLYIREDPVGLGMVTDETHVNLRGVLHGGALATLADMSLFRIASGGRARVFGATVALNLNFLQAGHVGRFIHSRGRVVRAGKSITFVEGAILDETEELLTFHGTLKLFRQQA